jgi:hypothetical protein
MAEFSADNALLRSLSKKDLEELRPHLELVDLKVGQVLYEMEDPSTGSICRKWACCP